MRELKRHLVAVVWCCTLFTAACHHETKKDFAVDGTAIYTSLYDAAASRGKRTSISVSLTAIYKKNKIEQIAHSTNLKKALTDRDLVALYRASILVFAYTLSDAILDDAVSFHAELVARNIDTPLHTVQVADALYIARRFEHSLQLAPNRNPTVLPLPSGAKQKTSSITVLMPMETGALQISQLALADMGWEIVVVMSENCHFAIEAARALQEDDHLKSIFTTRSKWIIPQNQKIRVSNALAWNAQFPRFSVAYLYRNAEATFLNESGSPVFFVFFNGKLVKTVSGWYGSSSLRELKEALQAL